MKDIKVKLLALTIMIAISPIASSAPNLIFTNGKIFTANKDHEFQESLAIENGKITFIGSNEDVGKLSNKNSRIVDLKGKVVMPGLIDSHSHPIYGGLGLLKAHVSPADQNTDFDYLKKVTKEWREDGSALTGDITVVVGLDASYWAKIDNFNQLFNSGYWKDKPLFFMGSDQHTGWANDALRQKAGLNKAFVDNQPKSVQYTIGKNKDGTPNGLVADASTDFILKVIPKETDDMYLKAGEAAMAYYSQLGMTSLVDAAVNTLPLRPLFGNIQPGSKEYGALNVYRRLAENGKLTMNISAFYLINPNWRGSDLDYIDKMKEMFGSIENLQIQGIKIIDDGVPMFPIQTAAMFLPYQKTGNMIAPSYSQPRLNELVTAANKKGYSTHIHAVGNKAVNSALNAIEFSHKTLGSDIPIDSIAHAQFIRPSDISRFKALNIIPSMQMLWGRGDFRTINYVKPYVGDKTFNEFTPVKSLLDVGTTIAGGSDWPVESASPWQAAYEAITRKGDYGVVNPEQIIDRKPVFYAYTINAAKMAGLDKRVGSLEKGKQADFIIVDRDVFKVSPEQLKETRVLDTYFKGNLVYSAE